MKKLLFLTIVGLTASLTFGCGMMADKPAMVSYDRGYVNDSYESENYETSAGWDDDVEMRRGLIAQDIGRNGEMVPTIGGAGSVSESKKYSKSKNANDMVANKASKELVEQSEKAHFVSGEEIQQKLIYTGSFSVSVYDVELKKRELLAQIQKMGGYLQSETNTELEIRVPAEKFFEIVKIIEKIGRVLNRYVVTKDVTEQFYDIQKRLEVKKEGLATLREILKKLTKIEDVILLQREIRGLIEDIETLEGKMRVMQSLIKHSLISITFVLEQELSKSTYSNKVRLPIPWLA
ncbi:MAG: DUF4349 domain-containing protein, partial [Planctomycetes bacterium]|nr:DUF4349 domain-containing protein [Planctomycetota bacterium]